MDKQCARAYIKTRLCWGLTQARFIKNCMLSMVKVPHHIASVKDLVNIDPHLSIDLIEEVLDISHGSVDTILK